MISGFCCCWGDVSFPWTLKVIGDDIPKKKINSFVIGHNACCNIWNLYKIINSYKKKIHKLSHSWKTSNRMTVHVIFSFSSFTLASRKFLSKASYLSHHENLPSACMCVLQTIVVAISALKCTVVLHMRIYQSWTRSHPPIHVQWNAWSINGKIIFYPFVFLSWALQQVRVHCVSS